MIKKSVVIHQPDFMPHLGFFDRLIQADLFISLDHVQFVHNTSRSWMNRDKIKTAKGPAWLTVSVKKAPRNTSINNIYLAETSWRADNLNLLRDNYRKAPGFKEIMPEIERLYTMPFKLLRDFNMASIQMLMTMLNISIPWNWSSSLDPKGSKNELVVDLLKKVSATHYISGVGALAYFNRKLFTDAGIEVIWQNYKHPEYTQQHGPFIPGLSTLDLLLNHGRTKAREILRTK